jgi:hypothetical protein
MLFLMVTLLGQQAPVPATLPIVPLENLSQAYDQHNDQEVVVAGIVEFGAEGTLMYLPTHGPGGEWDAMFVTLPLTLARKAGELEKRYLEQQKKRPNSVVVLRGLFHGNAKRIYGHQGCCRFELQITKVLSVG